MRKTETSISPKKGIPVSELRDGTIFEVCGRRYRKIHSNDCRAYVRELTTKHVVIKKPEGEVEFESISKGYCNISPNTMVVPITDVEDLI